MKGLIGNILDLARLKGVDYADLRVVRRQSEEIEVKSGKVEALTHDEEYGFGVRVLFQGAWGFACSSKVNKREMEAVFRTAMRIAKSSSKAKGREVLFSSYAPAVDRYQTPISIDPFGVSLETKLDVLLRADEIIGLVRLRLWPARGFTVFAAPRY